MLHEQTRPRLCVGKHIQRFPYQISGERNFIVRLPHHARTRTHRHICIIDRFFSRPPPDPSKSVKCTHSKIARAIMIMWQFSNPKGFACLKFDKFHFSQTSPRGLSLSLSGSPVKTQFGSLPSSITLPPSPLPATRNSVAQSSFGIFRMVSLGRLILELHIYIVQTFCLHIVTLQIFESCSYKLIGCHSYLLLSLHGNLLIPTQRNSHPGKRILCTILADLKKKINTHHLQTDKQTGRQPMTGRYTRLFRFWLYL